MNGHAQGLVAFLSVVAVEGSAAAGRTDPAVDLTESLKAIGGHEADHELSLTWTVYVYGSVIRWQLEGASDSTKARKIRPISWRSRSCCWHTRRRKHLS